MRRQAGWIVDIEDSVEPFEADWRGFATPANSTPFQAYDFMRIYFPRLAEGGDGKPVVARVRHADGRVAALFPMLRQRRHGLVWLRTDARPLDYCVPIFDPALSGAEIRAVISAMLAAVPGADLLYVNRIPHHFDHGPSPLVNTPNAARLRLSSWHIDMRGRSLDEIVAAQTKQFRTELRSRTKKLAQQFDRQFDIAFGSDVEEAEFDAFRALRRSSFEEKQRSNIVDDQQWGPLYSGLLRDGGQCRAWLASLRANGEIVATLYGLQVGRRVQVILPASRMGEWKYFRVGLQLFQETIAYFHGQNVETYDLSIGDAVYKRRIGCQEAALYDALYPASLAGQAYYLFWRLKVALRARMGKIAQDQ